MTNEYVIDLFPVQFILIIINKVQTAVDACLLITGPWEKFCKYVYYLENFIVNNITLPLIVYGDTSCHCPGFCPRFHFRTDLSFYLLKSHNAVLNEFYFVQVNVTGLYE